MLTKQMLISKLSWTQKIKLFSSLQANLYTRARRAFLYVPGDDKRKLQKIVNLNVDCVIFDCEDGVAINRKDMARKTISTFLSTVELPKQIDFGVRINSIESGQMETDLELIYGGKITPKILFLPKVNYIKDFAYFGEQLKSILNNRRQKLDLFFYAESCNTIMDLPEFCRRGIELSKTYPFRLSGIIFGSDDFCASLGATRSDSSTEILYARQRVVLIAKAFNLEAVDMVYINLQDDDGLKVQSQEGAAFGYTGKQVIHPKQVAIVQEAFMPSQEKINWAKELLKEYECYQKSGKGAFTFQGKMIDAPTVKQAENILEIIRQVRT